VEGAGVNDRLAGWRLSREWLRSRRDDGRHRRVALVRTMRERIAAYFVAMGALRKARAACVSTLPVDHASAGGGAGSDQTGVCGGAGV